MWSRSSVSGEADAIKGFLSLKPRYAVVRSIGRPSLGSRPAGRRMEAARRPAGHLLVGAIFLVDPGLSHRQQFFGLVRPMLRERLVAELVVGVVAEAGRRTGGCKAERVLADRAHRRIVAEQRPVA